MPDCGVKRRRVFGPGSAVTTSLSLGTIIIPAHHSVGSYTKLIIPSVCIILRASFIASRSGIAIHLGVVIAYDCASSFSRRV